MTPDVSTADNLLDEQRDRRALEAFNVDNANLEMLEALMDQFNIFESIGVKRQEARHSDLLAFLIDPRQNHRLGGEFARRFLQKALVAAQHLDQPLSPNHLDDWDLGRLTVRREWHFIDILLVDLTNHFVVLIENKIDSSEHSDQLSRYLSIVRDEYPESKWRLVALYLTPGGNTPSEATYLPVSYEIVAAAIEAVAETRRAGIEPAVYFLMTHYATLLRRHIVTDSQIADLCRQLYARHHRALDLIFEHRPDTLADTQSILIKLVESTPSLVLDQSEKQRIRFSAGAWEGLPLGDGWTKSRRILLFQFDNFATFLNLDLWIGPGPSEVRQRFIETASHHSAPFSQPKTVGKKWTSVFRRSFVKLEEFENISQQEIEWQIRERWSRFVEDDLPTLVGAMRPETLGLHELPADGE
jgi:hypothetical protein